MTATKPDQEVSPTLARAMYLLRQEIYGYLDEDERFMDLNMWDDDGTQLFILKKLHPERRFDVQMAAVLSWEARLDALRANAQPPKRRKRVQPQRLR